MASFYIVIHVILEKSNYVIVKKQLGDFYQLLFYTSLSFNRIFLCMKGWQMPPFRAFYCQLQKTKKSLDKRKMGNTVPSRHRVPSSHYMIKICIKMFVTILRRRSSTHPCSPLNRVHCHRLQE